MNTFPLSEPLVQRLAWTLIHFAWQGFAIASLLTLAVGLGRVRRSNWRYCFSLVALMAMTVSPIATFMILNVPTQVEQPVPYPQAMTTQSSMPHSIPDHHQVLPQDWTDASDINPASVTELTATPAASVPPINSPSTDSPHSLYSNQFTWQRIQPWIVGVWICGVALLSGRLMIGGIGVWQLRRRSICAPGWLVEETQRLAGVLRMGCPELKVSYRVQEAIALGFLRPMILLPAAWVTQMHPDMFEAVLAHELSHIRRHDLWINLFQRVVETLLFYHPAVWWLSRRLRIERELCCDELVVRVTQNPLRYAETLEHIGRLSLASHSAPLIVSIMGSRSMLSVRIRNILCLQPQQQSSWAWLAGVIPLLLAGVVCWSITSYRELSVHAQDEKPQTQLVTDGPVAKLIVGENKTSPKTEIDEGQVDRIRDVHSPKDNDPATIAKESEAIASGIDKSQVGTRRLAFAAIDPKVPFNVRTMTARQPYRQRTELSGGVQVSVEEAKSKWQMRANQVLVEIDSHDKPATGPQDTQVHLQTDKYVLTTKTPLRMTLSGNISVVRAFDDDRNSAQLTADKVTIDFDRSLLSAEKARFKSDETILESDHIAISFRGGSFRVGSVPEASSQPETHSIKANRRLRIGNNDKEGASKLVGDWKLVLPSGKTHELKLTQQDDGCLRLSKNLNFSGTFAYQNKRLELIEPTQDNIFDFIWTLQDDGSFKLTHEQHNVSAKYVGAVLVRSAADSENAAKSPMTKTQQLRSDRTRANDREAARNLVGRWLLTLPTKDLLDVELTAAEDGCLRLACRKEHDLVGRYSLNGARLELVDHENQDTDFVWQLDGLNTLKLIAERHNAGLAHLGAKLERIAAAVPQTTVFQIPNNVLAQTRELAAAAARKNENPKSLRPPGLEDLESPDAIKRAVDSAMLLLADSQKFSDGLIQLRYLGDEAFDALVAGSKSENAQVAKWSCSALEHRGLKAVGPLSEALKSSPDSQVRSVAASALGQTFQPSVIPVLIAALDDPDPQVRNFVLHSIKYPRDARAITPLQRFVNDPGVGHVAGDAIRHIQSPQGYAWWPADKLDLWQLCQDAHTFKGERYRDAELNQLTAGLKSDDGTITYCCLFALGRLRSKESISAIIHAPLSAMKFHVLAEIATPDAIEYLIQRLHSLNPQTRELTIQGLADGADRWAAPLLIALLDDPTLKVEAHKMEFTGRSIMDTWPESHRAHSALYSFFSRFGLTGEWRNLYANQTNNVPEEITNLKAWWKQHGADFVAGKKVPTPNLSTVFYNDP